MCDAFQSKGPGQRWGSLCGTLCSKVLEKLNEMQVQDSMNTYNGLVETCFKQCVTHFKAKDLDKDEEACVGRCVQKFMAYSQRVGQRFADVNRQHEWNELDCDIDCIEWNLFVFWGTHYHTLLLLYHTKFHQPKLKCSIFISSSVIKIIINIFIRVVIMGVVVPAKIIFLFNHFSLSSLSIFGFFARPFLLLLSLF